MKDEELLKGYLAYFVPVNLSKIYSILKELSRDAEFLSRKDLKIVDIGCGPSPSLISFFRLFSEKEYFLKYIRYVGVEREEKVINLAKKIVEEFKPKNISLNYEFLKADASDIKVYQNLKEIKPDILIYSNSLGELFDKKLVTMERFVDFIKYFTYKNEKLIVILIEPGSKKSSMRLHSIRDRLIEELQFYPYSPCLHNFPCPALKHKNWCYEERRWSPPDYLSFLRPAQLQINYLKFSYVILRKDGFNIKDTFNSGKITIKCTSHLLNEKGKSRLWGCWDGKLLDVERLKRDYTEEDIWLKIRKGAYFSIDKFEMLSERKIRIPKDAKIKLLFLPD